MKDSKDCDNSIDKVTKKSIFLDLVKNHVETKKV